MNKNRLSKRYFNSFLIILLAFFQFILFGFSSYATNTAVPDITQITNEGDSALVQWGVPMISENQSYMTNFDGIGNYSLNTGIGPSPNGDQTIVPEGINGSYADKVLSTWGTNGNCAWWDDWDNYQNVTESRIYVPSQRFYNVQNGENFSVTLQVKTQGQVNDMRFYAEGGFGRDAVGFDNPSAVYDLGQKIYVTQYAWQGSNIIYVDKPWLLAGLVNAPAIGLYLGQYQCQSLAIKSVNTTTGEVVLGDGIITPLYAGEELTTYTWNDGFVVDEGAINTNGQWKTISFNAKVSENDWNYSVAQAGLLFFLQYNVPPGSTMWMDNIQYGTATQVKLYRNGVNVPLTNDQSYLSEFRDYGATDTNPPNTPSNVQAIESDGTVSMSWSPPSDNGTNYTYNVSSVDAYGEESVLSPPGNVSITSGVSKYQIYKGSTLLGETSSTTYNLSQSDYQSVRVVAVDGDGNISPPAIPPSLTISPSDTRWTNQSVVLSITAFDSAGISHIQLPNGNWIAGSSANYTVGTNGTYTFSAQDENGNIVTQSFSVTNIDTTPPTAPVISNFQTWTNESTVPVTIISGTDSQSGFNRTEYMLTGATYQDWTTYTGTFNVVNEGITDVKARTVDGAGNYSNEVTSEVLIDRTPPTNTDIVIQKKS